MAGACFAGQKTQKWEDLPAAVQATILAHGGTVGQTADMETPGHNVDGMTVYEAPAKDKNGNVIDINVRQDGKLLQIKTDDAADRAAELAGTEAKQRKVAKQLSGVGVFSHPRDIYNPYLPLAYLKQDIFEGTEGGKKVRLERTLLPDKHRTFFINGQTVDALAMEDRMFLNGELEEVATDYFAQDDFGTVYYLGEDVDEYANGKVISHDGAWLLGKDTQKIGVILPAHPKVGDRFKSEDVSKDINESDEVIAVNETVKVPAGTFTGCVKVEEHLADGTTEYKYYAPGVGVVREVPSNGDEQLISHNGIPKKTSSAKSSAAPDKEAREALKRVGVDSQADAIWTQAVNNPNLPAETRAGLIEDLNEVGFVNPEKPTKAELPMINKRLELVKRLRATPLDAANAAALEEARKDLESMAAKLTQP